VGDVSTISRPSELEAILAEELYRPHRRGLALDLAYILGTRFGEEFERWEDVNQSATPSAKVRYFVRSWESFFGDSATPGALIEALHSVKPKPQDMIDKISQICL